MIQIKSRYGLVTKANRKKTHTLYFHITTPPYMMNHEGIGSYLVCLDLPGAVCTSRWKSWSIAQGTVVEFPAGKFASRQITFEYAKKSPRLLDCNAYIRVSARRAGWEVSGAKQSLEWEMIRQNGRPVGLNMLVGETANEASGILEGVKRNPPKRKPPVVKDNTPDDLPDGYLEAAKNTAWNIVNPFKNYLIKTLRPESFGEDIDHIPQLKKSVAQSFHNRVAAIKKACGDEITFRQVMNEIRTQVRRKGGGTPIPEEKQREQLLSAVEGYGDKINDLVSEVAELKQVVHRKDLRIQELHEEKVKMENERKSERLKNGNLLIDNDRLEKENAELKANLKTTIENNEALRAKISELTKRGPGPHDKGPPGIPEKDTIKTLLGSISRHLESSNLGRTEAWVLSQSKACLQGRTKPGWKLQHYLGKCIGTDYKVWGIDDRIFDRLKKFWGLK